MKRFIVISLAGIGCLTLVLLLLAFLFSTFMSSPEGTDFNRQSEVSSPNSEYLASHFVGMGGGAAGWCNEVVTVKPKSANGENAKDPVLNFKVFSVSCGSDVHMRWIGDSELLIGFSLKGRSGGASTYLRPGNSTGKIHVRYSIED